MSLNPNLVIRSINLPQLLGTARLYAYDADMPTLQLFKNHRDFSNIEYSRRDIASVHTSLTSGSYFVE